MAAKGRKDAHPAEELARLERQVAKELAPAYLLRGEERYFRDRALTLLSAAAAKRDWELCRHDAGDPEFQLATLLDDLTGGALFAPARSIVLQRIEPLLKKTGPRAAPALVEALKARLASGEPGCVVLAVDTLRADHAIAKAITARGGELLSCRRLWDTPPPWDPDPRKAELVQWLCGLARARKVALSPDEAAYVVAATGNDLFALESQLARIAEQGAGGVRAAVGWQSGGTPFTVAERLAEGDAARAVSGLEALFRSGYHGRDGTTTLDRGGLVAMLLASLSGKLRTSLVGSEALATGASPQGAMARAGVGGGKNAQKEFLDRTRLRGPREWRAFFEEVGVLERRSRSGATVDENDLALLALRWRRRAQRR